MGDEFRRVIPLRSADQYQGEPVVRVDPTMFGPSAKDLRALIDKWCEFFAAGPTTITDLEFWSRTPARLWNSLRPQTQLRRLVMKWGDLSDLTVLSGMADLTELDLGSSPSVVDVTPLTALKNLRSLSLINTKRVRDYRPLGELVGLEKLVVIVERDGEAESVDFLPAMRGLKSLTWVVPISGADYRPFLELTAIEWILVQGQREMNPTLADLEWHLPGVAATRRVDPDCPRLLHDARDRRR